MSIEDERDLRQQLGTELDQFIPGPVPFGAVVRQGRAVVIRRRLSAVAGLAVLAAAAISTPALLHQPGRPPAPVVSAHYYVTVNPPGPGSQPGLIAYGRINGRRWQVTGRLERLSGQPSLCFLASRSIMSCGEMSPPRASQAGDPATFQGSIGSRNQIDYASVRGDVAYLRVELTNGQTLALHPVAIFGSRHASFAAFAVPAAAAVTQVSAYSKHSELAYAIPFTVAGSVQTLRWLRPAEPALPAAVADQIGAGNVAGRGWLVTAYIGPWGTCFASAEVRVESSACFPGFGSALPSGQLVDPVYGGGIGNSSSISVVQTAPAVSYLILTWTDGTTVKAPAVVAGRWKYCAFVLAAGGKVVAARWTAYDAAGHKLGSGSPAGK